MAAGQTPDGVPGRANSDGPESRPAAEQPGVRYAGDAVTTGSIPVITDDMAPPSEPEQSPYTLEQVAPWLAGWIGLCVVAGGLAGLLWFVIVPLPVYSVQADGSAQMSSDGMASVYAADAWFVAIGLILSIALGLICIRWFTVLGWPVALLAALGALLAGLCCWLTGWLLGPDDFVSRLATAAPGSTVPIELTVRGRAALLAWCLGGVLPVLLRASLAPDLEEPKPMRLPWNQS